MTGEYVRRRSSATQVVIVICVVGLMINEGVSLVCGVEKECPPTECVGNQAEIPGKLVIDPDPLPPSGTIHEKLLVSDFEDYTFFRSRITGELVMSDLDDAVMTCPLCGVRLPGTSSWDDNEKKCPRCGLDMEAHGNLLEVWCTPPLCKVDRWRQDG